MDLFDLAILGLRIALIAVLYGFLFVVIRSSARMLRAVRPAPSGMPSDRPELRLIVLDPGGSGLTRGQALDVADGATLGRAERAELVLADSSVSAEHARVTRVGREWVIADLGSTNGTLVNDSRVTRPARLQHGDVLGLGGVQLEVAVRDPSHDDRR